MKIGVADYGMNVWYGADYDPEQRWADLKAIGYDGVERLHAISADQAMWKAARMRKAGVDFATCLGPTPEVSMQWTAALGKSYMWTSVRARDFDGFCSQANVQAAACLRWGVRLGLHNHLGSPVESQAQVEEFLARCPECGLILDTAHLAAADGNPLEIAEKYASRMVAVHLKDWLLLKPEAGLDRWGERGRFCELGAGEIGAGNAEVMKALVKAGYDGWVFVEQDTHLQDPLKDLAISRQYLREAGF
jgi:sugar phosphate isomerase/epimerase